jgi:DNA-binding PadR family transcriptional regulator
MEKLNKEELTILDALTPENGTAEKIAKKIKIKEKVIEKTLEKLEKMKLVSCMKTGINDDINFWSITREGEKYLSENAFINEFGELFTREEVKEIKERILKLPDELIDELFYRCGFIYSGMAFVTGDGKSFKALYDGAIEEIRDEVYFLENSLLSETPMKEILKNLEDLEKEVKNQNQTLS